MQRLARQLRSAGTRGLFVSATGTGKTLVSIRTADELGARLVLFVVPTLYLAAQTALAWRRDGHREHMVIVSSLDAAGRDPGGRPCDVHRRPARAGRADVGGGPGGGPDPGADGDLHSRVPDQDRGDAAQRVRRAAVRPGDHGRDAPHRGPRRQEVGDRPQQPAHPGGPPPLHDRSSGAAKRTFLHLRTADTPPEIPAWQQQGCAPGQALARVSASCAWMRHRCRKRST
ncbi:DEAD/DEAH box helicase family protein [Streptomyces sp. NPDC002644]